MNILGIGSGGNVPVVPQRARGEVVSSPIDAFRQQAQDRIGEAKPAKVEMGALLLWERSLANTPVQSDKVYTAEVGALNGYLTSLSYALGSWQGALAPAILEAAKDFRPEQLLKRQDSNGFTYLGGHLSADEEWQVTQQVDNGPTYCGGVRCAGFWNEKEKNTLLPVLDKLRQRAPELFSKLKGVTVQTWLGSTDPTWNTAPLAQGTYNSTAPGMLKLDRNIFRDTSRLEEVVFHEFGHVVDAKASSGTFKSYTVNAFWTQSKAGCVSEYARTSPSEDFAETFSFVIKNYDKIKQHPDLYFRGLGPLSEKFKYVFKDVLKQNIPEPSAAWTDLKKQLKAGQSPFGWVGAGGKIEQTNQELAPILRDMALRWNLDDLASNLTYTRAGRQRDQLVFVAERLLGFKPEAADGVQARPLSRGEIASQLQEYMALNDNYKEANAKVGPVEAECQAFVDQDRKPDQVPAEHRKYTGYLFGQKAVVLHCLIDKFEVTPETSWDKLCRKEITDPSLLELVEGQAAPAALKESLEARMNELMGRYTQMGDMVKADKVDQTRDTLRDQALQISYRIQALRGPLANLIEVGDDHLRKHMGLYCQETGQPDLMRVFGDLAPKPTP